MNEELEHSAGAIVVAHIDGQIMLLLVEHKDNTYVFPKGHIEQNETEEEAAKREISEETGVVVTGFKNRLGEIRRKNKIIAMFFAVVAYPKAYERHEEVFKWFTLDDALAALRYQEDRELLLDKMKIIAE